MFYKIIGTIGIVLGIGMFLIGSYIFALLLVGAGAFLLRHQSYSGREKLREITKNGSQAEIEDEGKNDSVKNNEWENEN